MTQKNVNEIIVRFIKTVNEKYGIIAAMLTGSYLSDNIQPNSDIDVFFIWQNEQENMWGRTFFEELEFEYLFT
jgi:predicted nucleotidyltransferase